MPTDDQITAIVELLTNIYARQQAILRLLERAQVPKDQINAELRSATARLGRIPSLQSALVKHDLTQLPGLPKLLESIPWDRWD
jgi:hypothetical protein